MREVEIMWGGEQVKVEVGPVTWGQYRRIRQKCIVIREHNGKSMQFRDMDVYDNLMMLMSIKNAPFEIIEQNIDKLSLQDGQKLSSIVREVNGELAATD